MLLLMFGVVAGATAAPAGALAPSYPTSVQHEEFAGSLARAGRVVIGGQPTAAGLAWAKAQGVRTVVDLRGADEPRGSGDAASFDEAAAVAALGLEYVRLPLDGGEAPFTPEAVDRFARLMAGSGDSGVLLHCASGRRASYLWTAWLVSAQGMPLAEAVRHGQAIHAQPSPLAGLLGREIELTFAADASADFTLHPDPPHSKFSRAIPPVLTVPSGSVIEAFTLEATGGQFDIDSSTEDLAGIDMERVHALTGPVYVEGAEPGDVLAVDLLSMTPGDWGWMAIIPHFGLLTEWFGDTTVLKTFALDNERGVVEFADGITVPLSPFAGVMGVAPATDEMLNTIPPRANGGNLDDPHLTAGTTVYFPVFVPGALFSIGDTHARQGLGEVSGTAMESPMRIKYRVRVLRGGRRIEEVQYENATFYATTGFGTTIDEAARKATRYMVDYLVQTQGLSREEAYMLCSLAGELKIAEAVDVPHMLVTMHIAKQVLRRH
jgi:uncharacterized protein (TIGR01244 family)